jgi:hypothetical protein
MANEEWDAWEPADPPRGFAERVVDAARREGAARSRTRRRAGIVVVATIAIAAAAAVAVVRVRTTPASGDASASGERTQIAIGDRAIAVLEPGARVAWSGDVVTQSSGNVFYRVEPGGGFRVHTAAGDVDVKGTCFRVKVHDDGTSAASPQRGPHQETAMNARDVKVGAVGVAIGAAAFVGVYEGRVALSHAKQSVELGAGESARADNTGVRPSGSIADGEKDFDAQKPANAAPADDPTMAANKNLADSVRTYKQRLEAIEAEKAKLQKDLEGAQQKLALATDASAPDKHNKFDLNDDDWKDLAKDGTVRLRFPCSRPESWNYSPKQLTKMGLAPQDGPPITNALSTSTKRTWAVIKPLCAQALGGAADVAEKVGQQACMSIVMDIDRQKIDSDEQVRQVAEIRAGMIQAPPADSMSATMKMLLALSYESKNVESDLAKSIGPDDAHRVVFGDEGGCWSNQGIGVGPRPQKQPE